ncbi:hypothetical protein [Oleiagrimonas soli]|uniref:Uncharacterized protein n=1 Tax=Oleiagrimonas soli TaxID=1543381 RepID=A0A099D0M1_9GAMM|nr:hypothetical protein [Oleiagrimonas soli]KGI78840.1 hypothetical protein LF63_0102590 [Oleiagrimonas soli]MBB6184367.1 hypothetical protein [Oleiagrimonas soli]
MLAQNQLKNLLHKPVFSNTDKLLLCLAVQNATAKTVSQVKEIASAAGLRVAAKWNISSLLSRSKGKAVRVPEGWELTTDGRSYVGSLVGPVALSPAPTVAASLRVHLPKIGNADVKAFVEEGIECFERRLYRSAVVLSWVGAVALLYDHVLANHLVAFNAVALQRDAKWKNAKTTDDLARMKEYDFIQVIEKLSIIGKSVKQELEKQLKLRNGCGHPNSLKIAENVVAAHLEILILNVFTKFA